MTKNKYIDTIFRRLEEKQISEFNILYIIYIFLTQKHRHTLSLEMMISEAKA